MFRLRWKGDCRRAFAASIICNCNGYMNSHLGEVIGFQSAGMSDIAVQKIEEIQKFVITAPVTLFMGAANLVKSIFFKCEGLKNNVKAHLTSLKV